MVVALLTPKQKKVLEYILKFSEKKGYAPSQQEIARHFRFKSLGTVQNYLNRLERHGVLQKNWNARRGVQILDPNPSPIPHTHPKTQNEVEMTVPLPLVGLVAAGKPIEAVENQETLDVPTHFIQRGEHFVLQVQGDSMIEDAILDGDYVIIKKQKVANNGQTVVALINHEATIKRFYQRKDQIELHPANPKYSVISVHPSQGFEIAGVLVGVMRKFS